jgi:ribosomal protein S12
MSTINQLVRRSRQALPLRSKLAAIAECAQGRGVRDTRDAGDAPDCRQRRSVHGRQAA